MGAHRIGKIVPSWNVTTETAAALCGRETILPERCALGSACVRTPLPTYLVSDYSVDAMLGGARADAAIPLSVMDRQIGRRRSRGDYDWVAGREFVQGRRPDQLFGSSFVADAMRKS